MYFVIFDVVYNKPNRFIFLWFIKSSAMVANKMILPYTKERFAVASLVFISPCGSLSSSLRIQIKYNT